MRTFLLLYPAVGLTVTLVTLLRSRPSLQRREVTYLRKGKPPVRKESRGLLELAAQVIFTTLAWPFILGFAFVFVPIHDILAGRSWKKYLAENPDFWQPER